MVLSQPAVPPFYLQGALSGPGVLPAPSLVAPGPMRSELGYFAWTLLPWDRLESPDAPPCVTSALAGKPPSTAEWRQGEPLRLRRQPADLFVKTHAFE